MRLHFARHGESVANVLNVFSNGSLDHPLTAAGEAQAREWSVGVYEGRSLDACARAPYDRVEERRAPVRRRPAPAIEPAWRARVRQAARRAGTRPRSGGGYVPSNATAGETCGHARGMFPRSMGGTTCERRQCWRPS